MNVTEAVNSRRSVRSYQDKPVDPAVLRRALETAQRSPSGGNTQPWNAVVLTGDPLTYPGKDGHVVYAEGVFVGYRHYEHRNIAPLFPFGHGLS